MKYKFNDRVKVRKDLNQGKRYDDCNVTADMEKLAGKIVTISAIKEYADRYKIKEDGNLWYWSESMFEELVPFTKSDLMDGDICTLRNGDQGTYKKGEGVLNLSDYQIREDLTNGGNLGKALDIVKVERSTKIETVFERKEEPKEMTLKEVCEELGYEVKIIKED